MSSDLKSIDRGLRDNYRLLTRLSSGKNEVAPALYPSTPDVPMRAKWAMATALGQQPKAVITVDQQDLQAMEDKAFAMKQFQFDDWIGETFGPTSNPAMMDYLHRIYPEYEERQIAAVKTWHEFESRLQQIKIRGPQNKEDLYIIYKLGLWPDHKTGRDEVLVNRWDPVSAPRILSNEDGKKSTALTDYIAGVFNQPFASTVKTIGEVKAKIPKNGDGTPVMSLF